MRIAGLNLNWKLVAMIKHGGNIDDAAIQYGIANDDWLDLSTGLNPHPWTLDKPIPERYYQKLPHPDAAFYSVASRYYKSNNLLAVPGSQAAIQSIPRLLSNKKVALPVPGYEEHLYHWQQNQHECLTYNPDTIDLAEWVSQHKPEVMVVINPNNPSCRLYDKQELLDVLTLLEKDNGLLIVDEAFLDTYSDKSLMGIDSEHLIVLRSLGKFFGLPGIRVGFVKAALQWREQIAEYLGSWAMNGPSLWMATQCLADFSWQQQAHKQLKSMAISQVQFLNEVLCVEPLIEPANAALTATDYFISYRTTLELARYIKDFYGQRGILVRLIDLSVANLGYEAIIRFGLCPLNNSKSQVGAIERFQSTSRMLNQHLSLSTETNLSQPI